jgi:phage minor structural protein
MIHVIDEKTDEILSVLPEEDFFNDEYEENLKGLETFKFSILANHPKGEHLAVRRRVVIPGEDGEYKEFILTDPLLINQYKEFYLMASYSDLRKQKIIDPVILEGQTPQTAGAYVLEGTGWQLGIVEFAGIRKIEFMDPLDAYDAIWQVAKTFELEVRFRVEVDENQVVGRYVDLITRRGELSGKELVFRKDLIGLKRRESGGEIATAIKCYGPVRDDGTRLMVIVEDQEALQRWGENGQHLWGIYEPQTDNADMTEERLRSLGKTELNKRANPVINYTIQSVALEHVYGYEHEKVRLGDTNRVKDEDKYPPIYLEARVISIKRSIKNRSRKTIEYGDFIEYTREQVQGDWKILQSEFLKRIEAAKQTVMADTRSYAYSKTDTDQKDESLFEDATIYTEQYAEKIIPSSPTPPANPVVGDKWVDTSLTPPQMKLYDGALWNAIKGEKGDIGPQGIQGLQGPKGDQGIQGPKGDNGLTSYFHVKYAPVSNPTAAQMTETPDTYIGTYVDFNSTDSTDPTKYTWARFEGIQGDKGDQGIPGTNGSNGLTSYLHIKYSNVANPTLSTQINDTGGTYIGQYTDFNVNDSTDPTKYTWTLIKGDKGDIGETGPQGPIGTSVTSVDEYYLASSSSSGVTTSTTGWTTTMQTISSTKKYLWNYEEINFSDGSSQNTVPVIIGVYGDTGPQGPTGSTGATGRSITGITEHYLASSSASGVTRTTAGWSTTMQTTDTTKKYLWNYETITWSSAPTTTYVEPIIIGVHGATGPQGPVGKDGIAHMGSTAPSNPATNSTWFQTDASGKVIAIKKWTGTAWTTAEMDAAVMNVQELSALSANLGNIIAGDIKGVTMNLASGKFIVDATGNVIFAGDLSGATGTFKGDLNTGYLVVGPDDPQFDTYSDGISAVEFKMPVRVSDGVYQWGPSFLMKIGNGDVAFEGANGYLFDRKIITPQITPVVFALPSMKNGWEAYIGLKYHKSPDGVVTIYGLMRNGSMGYAAFTLPVGCRPGFNVVTYCGTRNGGMLRVDVEAGGNVVPIAEGAAYNSWIALNISFVAEA